MRAGRNLRALLGCESLALVDRAGGSRSRATTPCARWPAGSRPRPSATGKPQVQRRISIGDRETDAVAAPMLGSDGRRSARSSRSRRPCGPGLVRATGEVADWVAAQVELGELDASRAALAEAEVRALRAQISPHFIYNSLNAIASFINTDPGEGPRARARVRRLHALLVPPARRLHDRRRGAAVDRQLPAARARPVRRPAQVTLQIAPEVLSTVVPFLSIQPLVENAVRHGLESKEGGGRITITAADSGRVRRDQRRGRRRRHRPRACSRRRSRAAPRGEHVGLRNVDARLRQVYGEEHGLVVETNVGAGTLVRMRVPKSQPGRVAASADAALGPDGRLER